MEKFQTGYSEIEIRTKVNEAFSVTEIIQYFKNDSQEEVEARIFLPSLEQFQFSGLKAKIGEKEVVSKVYSKEKAEEKYSDSIASGNVGTMAELTGPEKGVLGISVGKVGPGETVELRVEYLQSNKADRELFLFLSPQNFLKCSFSDFYCTSKHTILRTTINLSAKSPITDFEFKDKDSENNYIINKRISEDGLTGEMSIMKIYFNKGDIYTPVIPIIFKTKESSIARMISQFDEEKNETSYSLYWLLKNSSLTEEKDDNFTPGLFIFLIDQSGSMSGTPINFVKEALIVFMKSLPPDSYFQIIGFGSKFAKYQDEPLKYDNENVQKALSIIKGIKADMGGTEISLPLREILQERSNIYNKIDLPRHIMLLTDGEDSHKEECLKIITSLSDSFRVHSFGLGSSFDKDLIERSAFYGRGFSSFINDVAQIEKEIIKTLGKCLKPFVVDFSVKNSDVKDIYFPQKSQLVFPDSMMYFSFILPGKNALSNKDFEITGKIIEKATKKDLNEIVSVKEAYEIENGNHLSKTIIGSILKNCSMKAEEEISLSKKYQVLSYNTALFGEIIKNSSQKSQLVQFKRTVLISQREALDVLYEGTLGCPCGGTLGLGAAPENSELFLDGAVPPGSKRGGSSCYSSRKRPKKRKDEEEGAKVRIFREEKCNSNKNVYTTTSHAPTKPKPEPVQQNSIPDNFRTLIEAQNSVEGFWEKTAAVDDLNKNNEILKIHGKIEKFLENKEMEAEAKKRVISTFVVLYYMHNFKKEKLEELVFIIRKADQFLMRTTKMGYDDLLKAL